MNENPVLSPGSQAKIDKDRRQILVGTVSFLSGTVFAKIAEAAQAVNKILEGKEEPMPLPKKTNQENENGNSHYKSGGEVFREKAEKEEVTEIDVYDLVKAYCQIELKSKLKQLASCKGENLPGLSIILNLEIYKPDNGEPHFKVKVREVDYDGEEVPPSIQEELNTFKNEATQVIESRTRLPLNFGKLVKASIPIKIKMRCGI